MAKKSKNGIPVQEYELLNITMQGVEGGTAFVCADCGRVIFNTATIKGKQDGKAYIVGLTCVKKLLNKSIYFNFETMMDYEHELSMWNEAMNCRKWISKQQKQRIDKGTAPYELVFKTYTSREDGKEKCFIELQLNGKYQGSTKGIDIKYKSIFNGLVA